jgi:tetratricopeptide (TPR) repeat protein
MLKLICRVCGNEINAEPGGTHCVCGSCGSAVAFPKIRDELSTELYNQAVLFFRQREFDKAEAIYNVLITDDATDSEAYWGRVLCRYEVEYAPRAYGFAPLCRKAGMRNIFADADYRSALFNSKNDSVREIYEKETASIGESQRDMRSQVLSKGLAIKRRENAAAALARWRVPRRIKIAAVCIPLAIISVMIVFVNWVVPANIRYEDAKHHREILEARKDIIRQLKSKVRLGGKVTFGGYDWLVLATEPGKALLITDDIIANKAFSFNPGPWETSGLHYWLNNEFYLGFSEIEQACVLTAEIYGENIMGKPVLLADKVFLLSTDEAVRYLPSDNARIARYNGSPQIWWLRTDAVNGVLATNVMTDGSINDIGNSVDTVSIGVRPAIWVITEEIS